MKTAIRKNVMRRIYYSYVLSLVFNGTFAQGALLGASIAAFGRLTHVAALANNFMQIPVGATPKYISGAFWHAAATGEVMTILVTLVMVTTSAYFAAKMLRQVVVLKIV